MVTVIEVQSRRVFLRSAADTVAALMFGGFAFDSFGQEASLTTAQMRAGGVTAHLSVTSLRRNVSIVSGSGGKILVLTGREGKLAVDSGFATSKIQMEQALAAISDAVAIR